MNKDKNLTAQQAQAILDSYKGKKLSNYDKSRIALLKLIVKKS